MGKKGAGNYSAVNIPKLQRASLSLKEKANEIVMFFNNKCDDNGGLKQLRNLLKSPNNLRFDEEV